MATVAAARPATSAPPWTVTWAVVILAVSNVVFGILFLLPLPGQDDVPAAALIVGTALSLVTIALCWWTWKLHRWAAITLTVVALLNVLSSLPAFADPPSGTVITLVVLTIPLTVIPVYLLWRPESRAAYR